MRSDCGHIVWLAWNVAFILTLFLDIASPLNKPTSKKKSNIRTEEKELLDRILGSGVYDRKIRPSSQYKNSYGKDYTVVTINLMIRSINKIDDYNMEFSIQMTFREQWDDDRLRYNQSLHGAGTIHYLTLTDADKIWMPDLFFKNEKTGHFHKIILPNTYIRIFPDGNVLYSIRISLTLSCQMDLKLYPLDTQRCELRMASYGWTTDDLVFLWMDDEPVQVTQNLHLPRFLLIDFKHLDCRSNTTTGVYSCLLVNLFFKREFSYYLIQYYLPCCMLVIVSWVSFWLDQGAVPARVALGVTTLLTMSTQNAGINQSLPPVSYTKAIDVWTGACLTFVFSALLEFALVNYASRVDFRHEMSQAESLHPEVFEGVVISNEIDPRTGEVEEFPTYTTPHGYYRSGMASLRSTFSDSYGIDSRENGDIFCDSPFSSLHLPFAHCDMHSPSAIPKVRIPAQLWLSKFPSRSKRIDVISRIFFPIVFAMFNLAYWTTYLKHQEMKEISNID